MDDKPYPSPYLKFQGPRISGGRYGFDIVAPTNGQRIRFGARRYVIVKLWDRQRAEGRIVNGRSSLGRHPSHVHAVSGRPFNSSALGFCYDRLVLGEGGVKQTTSITLSTEAYTVSGGSTIPLFVTSGNKHPIQRSMLCPFSSPAHPTFGRIECSSQNWSRRWSRSVHHFGIASPRGRLMSLSTLKKAGSAGR